MKLLRLALLLLLVGLLPIPSYAAGLIVVSDPGQADRLYRPAPEPAPRAFARIPPVRPGMVLELVSHQVDVRIKDQFAVTKVVQEFKNATGRRLEGTFLFPAPKGAQLRKFTMDIDGKPVEAELLAADKARGIYEDIVRRQRDPALLEFMDRDLYKVRIFPIEPNSTKRVSLAYEQVLATEAGLVRYRYPMAVEKFSAKPIERVALKLELESGRPLKTIYSPTHDVEVKRTGERQAVVGYETAGKTAEQDFELLFSRENEGVGMSLLAYRDDDSTDGYFLLLASPGLVSDAGKVIPKDVVFVIDTSGSMAGGKLDQAKKALTFCIENLNEEDRFEIIRFATDIEPLFRELETAGDANRRRAREFVNRLRPTGGTAINDALGQAVAAMAGAGRTPVSRPQVVVFLTDGLPTVGETDIDRIVQNVLTRDSVRPRIFCFGIGTDVNTHLLDRITEGSRAASEYVLPSEDIEVKVSGFFAKIKDPVLTGVQLDFPAAAGVNRLLPGRLPDLFSGEQLLVVGRYVRGVNGAVKLSGLAGTREARFVEDVDLPTQAREHDFIPRLWATRRIGWLLDEIRLRGESAELKAEVTELARLHGVVTPYTAWLIVEDEERRGVRPDLQTLRQSPANRLAIESSRESYSSLGREQTGQASALSSRYGGGARKAERPTAEPKDAAVYDQVFLQRYGLDPSAQSRAARPVTSPATAATGNPGSQPQPTTPSQLTAQAKTISGKTFYENGTSWVDAAIQQHPAARRVKITFGSPEYFKLLRDHPAMSGWLTAGTAVQVFHAGTIYEIVASAGQ